MARLRFGAFLGPKAFVTGFRRTVFRPQDGSVFAPFLGRLGPPCRCVSPLRRVGSGPLFGACPGLCFRSVTLPKLCQRHLLPDLDAPFSAPGRLRFGSVFGPFGAAVRLFAGLRSGPSFLAPYGVEVRVLWSRRLGPWPCQSFAKSFVTGFETAPFWVRFWVTWGRRAAAFGLGWLWGLVTAFDSRTALAFGPAQAGCENLGVDSLRNQLQKRQLPFVALRAFWRGQAGQPRVYVL